MNARRAVRALALAAAAMLFGAAAGAQECQLQRVASLDMQVMPDGRVLVPVSLDDTPRLLMVDTGSPVGLLNNSVAQELGLKSQRIENGMAFYFVNGDQTTRFAAVPSLKIGPDEARYLDFLLVNRAGNTSNAGTLGMDVLKNFDIDFDFAAKKLNLFSQDHCEGKVVYWAREYAVLDAQISAHGEISAKMSLDDRDVEGVIDTGSVVTTVNESDSKRMFGIDTASEGLDTVKFPDGSSMVAHRFNALVMGGVSMPNPRITILPDGVADATRRRLEQDKLQGYEGNDASHNPQVILGMDALRHLHIYIAYKEKKIYVTAADAH
ncbi:MAG: aspartyl protease family protein [Rhizomicrobium sp.]